MTSDAPSTGDIEEAIGQVYRGPLDGFVSRRDALARALRDAGDKDQSAAVKKLRKPSRGAWTLDNLFATDPDAIEHLAGAVKAVVDAQSGRGSMATATRGLRDAANATATAAAKAAEDSGVTADRTTLVPAVLAVVADAAAFGELRRGRLVDIPAGGGLDMLTDPPRLAVSTPAGPSSDEDEPAPLRAGGDLAAVARARKVVERTETAAAEASRAVSAADAGVETANQRVDTAAKELRRAEAEARLAQDQLRDAKREAKTSREKSRKADRDAAAARAHLDRLT
ncbi:MAG TPA: hypothetical protein VGJ86_19750 [Acidimicrobiales bacterium]